MQSQSSIKASSTIRPHWVLMMVTFLYILINITHPELKGEAIACSMGLFIFYTWRRILLILITAAIAFALVSFFPFLAPVAFILMVIIFIARLSYILKNWRAVLAGFYMYALAFGFAFYGSVFGELIWGISGSPLFHGHFPFYHALALPPPLYPAAGPAHYGGGAASHHPPLSPLHQSLRQL